MAGGGVGWECAKCTFYHAAPGTRCVMCDNLRVSKEEMRDFVLGKTIRKRGDDVAVTAKLSSDMSHQHEDRAGTSSGMLAAGASFTSTTSSRESTAAAAAATMYCPQSVPPVCRNPYAKNNQSQKKVPPPVADSSNVRTGVVVAAGTVVSHQSRAKPTTTNHRSSTSTTNTGATIEKPSSTTLSHHPTQHPPQQKQQQRHSPPPPQKQDIWTRSIRPQPIAFAPGPVPLCPTTRHDWIYPIHKSYPIRDYQLEISKTAFLYDTLVSLPTGLGKTLIAAVVLYNYYRWFPTGKVVFLAPTLPLVHQQVKACYDIMGIPAQDTAILTGRVSAKERTLLWQERRVFFCTPQTVQRDIEHDRCPATQIVCVVLDEAHKACGAYAYVQVMQQLQHAQAKFRVLGLSATPGSEIKAIQKVITALRICKIEVRLDDDPTVKKYIHERHNELVVVKQGSAITTIERLLSNVISPVLDRLRKENALTHVRGNATLTPFCLLKAKDAYLERTGGDRRLDCYFFTALKFVEIRCHLRRTGIGMVRSKMLAIQNSSRGLLTSVMQSKELREVMSAVLMASSDGHVNETAEDRMLNNPKLFKLDEILKEHFERARACGESSRAIVFSQWRESVSEIVSVLSTGEPLLRPRHFVGQGKSSGGSKTQNGTVDQNCVSLKGMKQKEQQQVIKDFQEGRFNVLVCTCIGEEGLDIGEVDLIVNYDTLRSPIRMIQRVGRTGRKRDGRVVCLVSEGQEEKTMRASKAAEKTLGRALKKPSSFVFSRNVPMFPQAPELRKVDMSVSASFHMSQVGGLGPPTRSREERLDSGKKRREALEAANAWRLTSVQEEKRQAMFGDLKYATCRELKSPDGRLPSALRGRFVRGRSRALSSHQEQNDTFGFGATRKILAVLERQHAKESKRTRRRATVRSLRDLNVVGRLFPFDLLPASNRIGNSTNLSLAASSGETLSCSKEVVEIEGESTSVEDELKVATRQPGSQHTPRMARDDEPCQSSQCSIPLADCSAHVDHSDVPEPSLDAEPKTTVRMDASRSTLSRPLQHGSYVARSRADIPTAHIATDQSFRESLQHPERFEAPETRKVAFENETAACEGSEMDMSVDDNAEFILPTPAESSSEDSSSEDEAVETLSVDARREGLDNEDNRRAENHSPKHRIATEPSLDRGNPETDDEDDGIPLQDLRLPTQDSSSDEESVVSIPTVDDGRANDKCETQSHPTRPIDLIDLAGTPSSQLMPKNPLGTGDEALHASFLSANSSPEATPILKSKAASNHRKNVLQTQSTPATLSMGQRVEATPAQASEGDCLVDTPPNKIAPASLDVIDEVVCVVCHSGETSEIDPIVLCDGPNNDLSCNVAVHKRCYPISICLDGLDHWRCDPCETTQDVTDSDTSCLVCGKKEGARKLCISCDTSGWVHPYCRPWATDRSSLSCQYCASIGAVGCSVESCTACAHPHCALSSVEEPWVAIHAFESEKGLQDLLFCHRHESEARSILRIGGDDRQAAPVLPRYVSFQTDEPRKDVRDETLADNGDRDMELPEKPKRKRLQKKSTIELETTSPVDASDDELADTDDDERELKRQRIRDRLKQRHRGILGCKFLADEAEIDSDDDVDGDMEDEECLRRIEEEEEFYNSFINDSSQLGAATQDDLDRVDESVTVYRAFDNEKERMNQFATPVFNRRMKKQSRNTQQSETPASHHEWDEPTPASAPSSQKGLGNMHFIRSVLEHHRNGGEADEIEALYNQVADEHESSEDEARHLEAPRDPSGPVVMKYVASDSENDSDEENVPFVNSVQSTGLSKEQRALIDAKRQEALRRKQNSNRAN